MDNISMGSKQPIDDFVSQLKAMGIKLWVEGEGLRYKAPKGVATPEILKKMSERKEEIIKHLKLADAINIFYAPIEKSEHKDYYTLSAAQKRMFILHQIDKDSTAYNITQVLRIKGNFDKERFAAVIDTLIERHESLRTSFVLKAGEPVQIIHDHIDFKLEYEELDENVRTVEQIIDEFIRPYDLSVPPLFRYKLVKTKDEAGEPIYLLLQDMHHIISDGVSESILVREVNALYAGQTLPLPKIQYRDFALWHEKLLVSPQAMAQKEFWVDKLKAPLPVLNLPTDFIRPSKFSFKGSTSKCHIDKETSEKLYKLARDHKATLFMLLLSGFYVLLSKYSRQDDIIIGTPVAGRRHADTHDTIGMFLNTLALRNYPQQEKTFEEFLKEVSENVLKSFDNQDYPFERLVDEIGIQRDMSRNTLFDAMFILQNTGTGKISAEGIEISSYDFDHKMAQADITLIGFEKDDGITLDVNYCTSLFKEETIRRFAGHYINILREVIKNPGVRLCDIEMMSEDEKKHILVDFNDTQVDYPSHKTIHQLFEEQVEIYPEKTALVFQKDVLTYRELNTQANRLAWTLLERGVQPGDIVGILVERSFDMIVGMMGILKAGGAYLPIDHEYPLDRVLYMLKDSGTHILVTQKHVLEGLGQKGDNSFMEELSGFDIIDMEQPEKFSHHTDNPGNRNTPESLAYVIYTSGSTGKPKGVMLEHRSVVNFFKGVCDRIDFGPERSILALTTISFDIHVLEILLSLSRGLKIVIADERQQLDPKLLNEVIDINDVEMIQTTPSRMQLLLKGSSTLSCMKKLKVIMVGGEAFPQNLFNELKALTDARIFNMYGPTETTVWSTIGEIVSPDRIDIGYPIANTRVYLLDKFNSMSPIGVAGELCIAGDGLARGYLNRPELTDEKFVADPFYSGEKMYRTGDLARYLPDGKLECLGRIDNQVKIRGYRIELGEVENQLLKHEAVKEAAVVDKVDKYGNKYLCAYIVNTRELSVAELREHMLQALPEYMVPSHFINMEKLPQTPNGKIDRKALPEPSESRDTGVTYEAPRNELEEKLVDIWQRILNIERVGINDSFFELGGHSLLAIKLEVEMEKNNFKFTTADIFKYRTIKDISAFLSGELIYNDAVAKESKNNIASSAESYNTSQGKVIQGIEPFNEVFYKNCFYNSAFPVAKYYNKSVIPFLVNDILTYERKQGKGELMLGADYYACRPVEEILEASGLTAQIKTRCEDIVSDLIYSISNGNPVITGVDCFYESIRNDMYMKNHWPHTLLVYGYDLANKTFNIIEHKFRDNLAYEKMTISFADIVNASNGYVENFPDHSSNFLTYEITCAEQTDASQKKDSTLSYADTFAKNFRDHETVIAQSFGHLDRFIEAFSMIPQDSALLEENAGEMLSNMNEIINAKIVEKYKIESVFSADSKIAALINEIIDKWTYIRGVIAKYVYSSVYKQKPLLTSVERLRDIRRLEDELYQAILSYNGL